MTLGKSLADAQGASESSGTAAARAQLTPEQTLKIEGVPALYRKVFIRAYSGGSRSAAIKAFCLDCVGFTRADITNCTAKGCALYPYRPYQAGDDAEDEISTDAAASVQTTTQLEHDEAPGT